jgi:quinol-cytochrome oxidoreductase complex cytochrome b subunit
VIPACLLILMPFHFWRVRKSGGLVIPRTPQEEPDDRGESVPAIPNLIMREVVVALVLIAILMIGAVALNAPLEAEANPGLSPNPTKAPWYFAGIQELLLHFHPLFAVMVIPLVSIAALLILPYLRYDGDTAGVWFCSDCGRKMSMVAVVFALIVTPLGILADEYIIDFAAWLPSVPAIISNGLIPVVMALASIIGFYWLMKKKYSATNNEAILSVFILLLVAFIILTITCIWFRGSGMALMWPWEVGVAGP